MSDHHTYTDIIYNFILFTNTSTMLYTTSPYCNWEAIFDDNCEIVDATVASIFILQSELTCASAG